MCEQECQQRPRKGTQFPGTRAAASYTAMWTLSIKLWSSPKPTSAPNHGAMSPAPNHIISLFICACIHSHPGKH